MISTDILFGNLLLIYTSGIPFLFSTLIKTGYMFW